MRNRLTTLLAALSISLLSFGVVACNGDDSENGGNGDMTDTGMPDTTEDGDNGEPETANLQLIHNSPDPGAAEVDVFAQLPESTVQVADNLPFRQATPYLTVPANTEWDAVVAVPTAGDDDTLDDGEIVAEVEDVSLTAGTSNLAIVNGVLDSSNFQDGVSELSVALATDVQTSPSGDTNADIQLFHGAPDAPAVDIAPANGLGGENTVADGLSYGNFGSGYVGLAGINVLDIGTDDGTFVTNIQTPQSLGADFSGGVFTAVASGFLTTGNESPDDVPGFRIVAFPNNVDATTDFPVSGSAFVQGIPLPGAARAQLIHAVPADAYSEVNISVDGTEVASEVPFTGATGFLSVPAGVELPVLIESTSGNNSVEPSVTVPAAGDGAVATRTVFARGGADDRDPGLTAIESREPTAISNPAESGEVAINVFHAATPSALSPVTVSVQPDGGGQAVVPETSLEYNNATGVVEIAATTSAFVRLSAGGTDYDFDLQPLADEGVSLDQQYATFYAVNGDPARVFAATTDGSVVELTVQ